MTNTKRCTKCGEIKLLTRFSKDATRRDGHGPWCKACKNAYDRARYQHMRESGGVPPKRRGPAPRYPQLHDETWLRTQIEREFLSAEQVAESLGCNSKTVYYAMRRYGIRTVPKGVRWALRARLEAQREGVRA